MKKCYDCTHVEMCGWRKEVEEQGCEFFDDGMVWIPVSEKLPEKDGRYLVAYWLMKDYMWTDIAWFGNAIMPNRPMQGRYFYISGDGVDVVWDSVLAWMPLPEPYKRGDTND